MEKPGLYIPRFIIGLLLSFLAFLPVDAQDAFIGSIDGYIPKVKMAVSSYYEMSFDCMTHESMLGTTIASISKNFLTDDFICVPDFLSGSEDDGVYDYGKYVTCMKRRFEACGNPDNIRCEQDNFKFSDAMWTADRNGLLITVEFDSHFFCGQKSVYSGRSRFVVCFPHYLDLYGYKYRQVTPADWSPDTVNNAEALSSLAITETDSLLDDVSKAIVYYKKLDFSHALPLFTRGAQADNPYALGYLGDMFLHGYGVPVDTVKAFGYFDKAYKTGHPFGLCKMSSCFDLGIVVAMDHARSFELVSRAAQSGEPCALSKLGVFYQNGLAVDTDYNKAFTLFQEAASKGDASGLYFLGQCYQFGYGCERDTARAFSYMEKACDNGFFYAAVILANMYRDGVFCKKDYSKMFHYAGIGMKANECFAYLVVGEYWFLKEYGSVDYEKALQAFLKALQLGALQSAAYIGQIYADENFEGYDLVKALHYLQIAADNDTDGSGHFQLSDALLKSGRYALALSCCETGAGVYKNPACFYLSGEIYLGQYSKELQDYEKALKYFQKAADLGYKQSFTKLGYCYLYGYGTLPDRAKAILWLGKASEAGFGDASCELGNLYASKIAATKVDYAKAAGYYKLAIRQSGHADAYYRLGMLNLSGKIVPADKKDAVRLFTEAYSRNHDYAGYSLGECYSNGWGVDIDIAKAKEYYKGSARLGNRQAAEKLKGL